ncbi:MAG TPA: peptidylprolyl isomerase [Gemmatimonadales bacterium]|nr:peptidylprolyl isomerase [Gemmatimonadales bacterium]
MTAGGFRRLAAVAALLTGSAAAPLWGQQVRDTVDRIVAVVGYTPILGSEIDEEIFARFPQSQGLPTPGSPEWRNLRRQVLQELIDVELLYQAAQTDTGVKVTEEQVDAAVDQQVRNVRQKYPSDQDYRNDLRNSGFQTPEEYRRWLTERQRRELIRNAYLENLRGSGKLKAVIPTEKELRAAFEERRGLQKRPETISFAQVVVAPKPAEAARTRAFALADSILMELRKGADFATAARRFSMDPGSKEQGGSLGWFRRGVMHPAFESVAFNMRPGFVSDPVETPFGIHLIQVERIQPSEVSARHILIMPEIRSEDADSARALADRIRAALVAGASFDSLQRLHHDPLEERDIRDFPSDKLLPAYAGVLGGLGAGEVAPVFILPNPILPDRSKYAVVQVLERKEAGEFQFEDVKDMLRNQLGEQLAIRRYLDKLRASTYVEIRGT